MRFPKQTRTADIHVRRMIDGRRCPSYSPAHRGTAHRPGFTLIELLVSIAILAVLMAMMLPAVQSARQSAQATQCRSHLAQLGEAFHAYHLTQGSLPSGSVDLQSPAVAGPDRFVWGWAVQLLPYLGEQNQAAGLDRALGVLAPRNAAILTRIPPGLYCPLTDRNDPVGYAGCHHDRLALIDAENNGVLFLNSHVRFEELVDGLHQTLLLGEAVDVRWAEGTSGSLRNFGAPFGERGMTNYVGVDAETAAEKLEAVRAEIAAEAAADEAGEDESVAESSESEMGGSFEEMPDEFDESGSDDPQRPPPPPGAQPLMISRTIGFWPAHRDGGHFLLADGAVRVISRSINQEVLRKLANRLDHRDVGDF